MEPTRSTYLQMAWNKKIWGTETPELDQMIILSSLDFSIGKETVLNAEEFYAYH